MRSPCCAPNAQHESSPEPTVTVAASTEARPSEDMALIEGSSFLMGSDDRWAYPADGEGPVREISLDSFWLDRVAVSNEAFASFVDASGYATEAERFGWSFVFAGLLPDDFPPTQAVVEAPWWRKVDGADGDIRKAQCHQSRIARATLFFMSPGTTRRLTAPGPNGACRPRRSGSSPRAADSRAGHFPGVTSASREVSTG